MGSPTLSVVYPRDQLVALDDLDLDPAEPDLVARLARVEHLVAGLDPRDVGAHRRDDARAAGCSRGRRGGEDQAGARLRLVARRLDDEVLVERLEGDVHAMRVLDHARTIARASRCRTSVRHLREPRTKVSD